MDSKRRHARSRRTPTLELATGLDEEQRSPAHRRSCCVHLGMRPPSPEWSRLLSWNNLRGLPRQQRHCPSVAAGELSRSLPLRPAGDPRQQCAGARSGDARWLSLRGRGSGLSSGLRFRAVALRPVRRTAPLPIGGLLVGGVSLDRVEVRIADQPFDQWHGSADPCPVWVDVRGDTPRVVRRPDERRCAASRELR